MKRFFLVGVLALVVVVVGGFFAAREVAQSSNTPAVSSLASAAPEGGTLSDQAPSFSVGRAGASGLSPADIFNIGVPPPPVSIPCPSLGLNVPPLADCGALPPTQDNVDALSYGVDFTVPARSGNWLFFSVAAGSTGLAGTAVNREATAPCVPAEPEADEFASAANGNNSQYYDGNGAACDANAGGPIGLADPGDDLDALDEFPGPQLDYFAVPGPDMVFFSLDPASPSLGPIGPNPPATAGDILLTGKNAGVAPFKWATFGALGLQALDDIDALCIKEGEHPVDYYRPGVDLVWLSLAPGSPTLTAKGWSAADVIQAGLPVTRVKTAAQLGLAAADNLDALKCLEVPPLPPTETPTPTNTPTPTPTNTPTPTPTSTAYTVCGNGIVEPPTEQCDPPAVFSAQCPTNSYCNGFLWCEALYVGKCTDQCLCEYPQDRYSCSCDVQRCGAECATDADCPGTLGCSGPPFCACGIGGIAELPPLAGASAEEAGASAGGSGWSSGAYAALAAGLAAAAVVLSAGAWYARRRLLR